MTDGCSTHSDEMLSYSHRYLHGKNEEYGTCAR